MKLACSSSISGCLEHLRGHEVDLCIVCGLHTAFDPQHLTDGVLVTVANLKLLPALPEMSGQLFKKWNGRAFKIQHHRQYDQSNVERWGQIYPGITDLRAVRVDGSRSVNLSKFALHVSEAQAHVSGVFIWQDLHQTKLTHYSTKHVINPGIFWKRYQLTGLPQWLSDRWLLCEWLHKSLLPVWCRCWTSDGVPVALQPKWPSHIQPWHVAPNRTPLPA